MTTEVKYQVGIDIGSKTVKVVILDEHAQTFFEFYDRHLTDVKKMLSQALDKAWLYVKDEPVTIGVTGSAGIRFAELCGLPFIQEVLACKQALASFAPQTDVAIELGGEDSKILFLNGGEELRMNDTCAGGTGGFIDTIAGMFDLRADRFNSLALGATTLYPIASRCAVFAMSDVRPLFNEGAKKEDIAASTFAAVATQCITGLAAGREIAGNITLLGGPFYFLTGLRKAFREQLPAAGNSFFVPPEAHLFVAKGAALYGADVAGTAGVTSLGAIRAQLAACAWTLQDDCASLPQLFADEQEYADFRQRHDAHHPQYGAMNGYRGRAYLGIDSGSTTLKCVLIGEDNEILFKYYERVAGNLIDSATEMFKELYRRLPNGFDGSCDVDIAQACVCGYGEDFFLQAFKVDGGEVETVCHTRAAAHFVPEVDTILDIGGQDIKYIKVSNQTLDDIVLNEACSSGCGSLIGGFAYSMNYKIEDFARISLMAATPVDLGTRCTVFMTSRVRHAQKEGAAPGDIAAGLAYSVIRNALYKVIRLKDSGALGRNIVVSGGTFKNDAVLRAFEKLTGHEVYRSVESEFMGAFGAALIAKQRAGRSNPGGPGEQVFQPRVGVTRKSSALPQGPVVRQQGSTLLSLSELVNLRESHSTRRCGLCANNCLLTVTEFYTSQGELPDYVLYAGNGGKVSDYRSGGSGLRLNVEKSDIRRLITGNRCSRALSAEAVAGNPEAATAAPGAPPPRAAPAAPPAQTPGPPTTH
ncbi:MAG: acyl-CoA dehydratase activase, partial [Coriobacteriales bacterium]|nr:acyl-CoA dehydratase activase [Coriobacteriales bacterium]